MNPIERILARLPSAKKRGKGYMALCPAHEDRTPSLSIGLGEAGRVLVKCHAGCPTDSVLQALGLTLADLAPPAQMAMAAADRSRRNGHAKCNGTAGRLVATYPYRDEAGRVLYEKLRYEPKGFSQRRPNGKGGWLSSLGNVRRVLYRLPELLAADRAATVYIVEGEKDADALAAAGLVTTTSGGAKDWTAAHAEPLAGRHVAILPDNDKPGREHAQVVAESLTGRAASVRIIALPDLPIKGDVSDWLAAGHQADELAKLVEAAPEWTPSPAADRRGAVCLADVRPEPLEWLWPGRLALGKLSLIVGDPEAGKSFLSLDVAARVSCGRPWPDSPAVSNVVGSVLLISAEDDPADTIRPRLEAAGAALERIHCVPVDSLEGDGLAAIAAELTRLGDVRMVVIDPISAYLGRADSHNNAEVRGVLRPLSELAGRHRAALVAISHLNKCAAQAAQYRTMGSLAFAAAARASWFIVPDRNDPTRRLLLAGKNNLSNKLPGLAYRIVNSEVPEGGTAGRFVGRVEWEPAAVQTTLAEVLATTADGDAPSGALDEAKTWLGQTLANRPLPAKEVKRRANNDGIAPRTLDRAKAALGVTASRSGFKKGKWVWTLPPRSAPSNTEERQTEPRRTTEDVGAVRNSDRADEGKE